MLRNTGIMLRNTGQFLYSVWWVSKVLGRLVFNYMIDFVRSSLSTSQF